jgi:hypothetical protein
VTVHEPGCCDPVVLADAEAERDLGVRGFHALWRGERPDVSTLTDDPTVVARQVASGRLEVDEHGVLVGIHGLVSRPTRHRIEHADGLVYTWCALDAIGIPAALGIDAMAVTSCPTCDTELRVHVHAGAPSASDALRLWLPGGPCDHLVQDFCNHANLFCDVAHLDTTVDPGQAGRVLTIHDAASIGRQTWSDVADQSPPSR